ncbi:MAG: hypothetical protein H0X26_10300 [Alphaproteobacteria bacterium]|nr:hypothetical protein [Alphaproteobacteria bacterium]
MDLSFNKFTFQGLKHILNALSSHPNLAELILANNLIDDEGGKELLTFLETKPFLEKIDVDDNPMCVFR